MSDSAIRFIDAGTVSGIRSQTIYHALGYAQTRATPDTIVFATPESPYMCLGFFQDAARELDLDFCEKNDLPVVRREQGGGAVYIDSDQLFVQWIFQPGSLPLNVAQRFRLFVEPMIETYKRIGINAYFHPINDVHVGGKKIVGTGAAGIGEAEIVTGNFLFDFDFDTMIRALNVPDEDFRSVFGNSLRQYLTTINQELEFPPSREEIKKVYAEVCQNILKRNLVPGEFTGSEMEKMLELDFKMRTPEWLFQYEKPVVNNRMVKVHAGVFVGSGSFSRHGVHGRVVLTMNNDHIESVGLSGNMPWLTEKKSAVEAALKGLKLDVEILKKETASILSNEKNGEAEQELEALIQEIIEISKRKPRG